MWLPRSRSAGSPAVRWKLSLHSCAPSAWNPGRASLRVPTSRPAWATPPLSPLLVQMAVYSAIDATERTVGAASTRLSGEIEFQNAPAPVRLNNIYSADNGSAQQASLSAAIPVAFVMQSGFRTLQLKRVA